MPGDANARIDLSLLTQHLPGRTEGLRLMLLNNVDFRSICEDFCLAHRVLKRFESQKQSQNDCSAEVSDYQVLIAELGDEMKSMLDDSVLLNPASECKGVMTGSLHQYLGNAVSDEPAQGLHWLGDDRMKQEKSARWPVPLAGLRGVHLGRCTA